MRRRSWQVLSWMVLALGIATPVRATDLLPQPGSWELGLRSGYSIGQRNVDMVPVNVRIGYTLFKGQKWIIPRGAFEIGIEPFVSVITSVTNPDKRSGSLELGGLLPVLTYYFDLGNGFYPGAGAIASTFRANIRPALYLIDLADNPYRASTTALSAVVEAPSSGGR